MHNRAALFERDFVHQGFHKVNTSTVLEQPVFCSGGIRDSAGVKPSSLVPNGDQDFSVCVAAALYVHTLAGILTVTVNHGIRKGFTQGDLDIDLAAIRGSKVQNEPHELIHELRDNLDLTRKRLPQFNKRSQMESLRNVIERLCVSHVSEPPVGFPRSHSRRPRGEAR
jgi:hypothetical protein